MRLDEKRAPVRIDQRVGATGDLRQRRRTFVRTLSPGGLTTTFTKLKGVTLEKSVEDLFRLPATPAGSIATPAFVQDLTRAFLDAKTKREDADYNLNEPFSEMDARQLRRRVIRARELGKEPPRRLIATPSISSQS